MEQLIAKLKIEVHSLKVILQEHGINQSSIPLPITQEYRSSTDISTMNEMLTQISDISVIDSSEPHIPQQIGLGEDLTLKITELQNEFEHYKEYADTRIMSLEDQVERMNQQNESTEELQNKLQGSKFIVKDLED